MSRLWTFDFAIRSQITISLHSVGLQTGFRLMRYGSVTPLRYFQVIVANGSTDVCRLDRNLCANSGRFDQSYNYSIIFDLRLFTVCLSTSIRRVYFIASHTRFSRKSSPSSGTPNVSRHVTIIKMTSKKIYQERNDMKVSCCFLKYRLTYCNRYVWCLHDLSRSDHHRNQSTSLVKAPWHQCHQRLLRCEFSSASCPCPSCAYLCQWHSARTSPFSSSLALTIVTNPNDWFVTLQISSAFPWQTMSSSRSLVCPSRRDTATACWLSCSNKTL